MSFAFRNTMAMNLFRYSAVINTLGKSSGQFFFLFHSNLIVKQLLNKNFKGFPIDNAILQRVK